MTNEELQIILKDHAIWLLNNNNGKRANLRDARLSYANLRCSDLRDAHLSYANLRGSDLRGADLRDADLHGVKLNECTTGITNLCPEGAFIGWKKGANFTLIKLKITTNAKRSNATTLKCRCSKARVLAIYDKNNEPIQKTFSNRNHSFIYEVGKIVKVDNFDEDRWNECSTGIHFFIDKEIAKQYD